MNQEQLHELDTAFYAPSGSYEYFDGVNFYNQSGDRLRNQSEYNNRSEGYTPFGDE